MAFNLLPIARIVVHRKGFSFRVALLYYIVVQRDMLG